MGRHMQLVMGPAGSGKSTYCAAMDKHFQACKRSARFVNLDPAAEHFHYRVDLDIRSLISLDDVISQDDALDGMDFGPNGGLVFCMEYLVENLTWLKERFDEIGGSDDEYFVVDCPGQIELYTHNPVMRKLCKEFQRWNITVCGVYLIDSLFVDDPSKYVSGTMMALSTMIQMEIAQVNIISKCDLKAKADIETTADRDLAWENGGNVETVDDYRTPDTFKLRSMLSGRSDANLKLEKLHGVVCSLLEEYSMVNFLPLNVYDEESVEYVLLQVDHALQFGEDVEPKTRDFDPQDPVES